MDGPSGDGSPAPPPGETPAPPLFPAGPRPDPPPEHDHNAKNRWAAGVSGATTGVGGQHTGDASWTSCRAREPPGHPTRGSPEGHREASPLTRAPPPYARTPSLAGGAPGQTPGPLLS